LSGSADSGQRSFFYQVQSAKTDLEWKAMEKKSPTCIDCDQSFELGAGAALVVCSAHLDYRDAAHPATCEHYAPRKALAEIGVTEVEDSGGK
jgi:hypothetical protein